MTRTKHASDMKVEEVKDYIARARVSTVQRLLDEELSSERPRAGAVDALRTRLAALEGQAATGQRASARRTGAQGRAAQQVQEAAGQTRGKARQATTQAQDVAGQAKEKAQEVTSRAQQRIRDEVGQRSMQAGDQVQSTAEALRRLGDELRSQGQEWPATLAEQGAQKVQQVAAYLRTVDVDQAIQDAEDFMRRQPAVVVAGGLALGFAASRLVKAGKRRAETAPQAAPVAETVEVTEPPLGEATSYDAGAVEDEAVPAEVGVVEETGVGEAESELVDETADASLTPGQRTRARAYGEGFGAWRR